MTKDELIRWLKEDDPAALETLWARADAVRRENVGDAVHLRGLIELGNVCVRQCAYCGIRAGNPNVQRYRMSAPEILEAARAAASYGYGTVVMQAGEDYGFSAEMIADVIRTIKTETKLAVTLSLGERPTEDLRLWKDAGANRYLLRFETSDRELYRAIHPDRGDTVSDRIAILKTLQSLGYETGSGVMIGIPGQRYEVLADDLQIFHEMDLDMIGVGPYLPHPETPLGQGMFTKEIDPAEQVPNTELMGYKMIALTRILCPQANLPSTTAIATLNQDQGRELGLCRGANVIMPNVTPLKYRKLYEIYPAKACIDETEKECHSCMRERIESIGRTVGTGPGGRCPARQ